MDSRFHRSCERLLRLYAPSLSPSDYSRVIECSFQRTRPPHGLTLTVYEAFSAHHSPDSADPSLLQHAIHVLSLHRRYAQVIDLWYSISRRSLPVDATTLGIVLHACDQQNDDLAWHIFWRYQHAPPHTIRTSPSPSSDPSVAAEGEQGKLVRHPLWYRHAALEQRQATSTSSPFNLLHYTHIISALMRRPSAYFVPNILAHMHQHRVRPDLYLYTRILSVLASQRLYRAQMDVLREMPLYGVVADEKCFYLVLSCHADAGRWEDAMELIDEMRERRMRINEFIYEAAIVACESAGKIDAARRIAREMHSRSIPLTWPCYASLLQQTKAAGEWEWALHLYDAVKGRQQFREHTISNDAVVLAAQQLTPRRVRGEFIHSRVPSLNLSPQEIATEVDGHLGPLGYWTLVEDKVQDDTLDAEVREKLTLAVTPTTEGRLGVLPMQLHQQQPMDAAIEPLMHLQPPSHARHYRLNVPSQPVDHSTAALDVLLHCILWKTKMQLRGEQQDWHWLQRVQDVPSCFDSVQLRCYTRPMPGDGEEEEFEDEVQPSIGQVCADSVTGLWSLIKQPFSPSTSSPASPAPPLAETALPAPPSEPLPLIPQTPSGRSAGQVGRPGTRPGEAGEGAPEGGVRNGSERGRGWLRLHAAHRTETPPPLGAAPAPATPGASASTPAADQRPHTLPFLTHRIDPPTTRVSMIASAAPPSSPPFGAPPPSSCAPPL